MMRRLHLKFISISFLILLAFTSIVYSQNTINWRSEATNGNWEWGNSCDNPGADDNWYNNTLGSSRWRPDCYLANRIYFANDNQLNMNLNSGSDYSVNWIEFNGTGDRVINGPRSFYFKQNNGNAKIENNTASTTHTFNVNVNIEAGTWMEINPINGALVFNNPIVNYSGNTIYLWGFSQATFFGDIMNSSGTPGVNINQTVTAVYSGISKTYTGTTTINNGATLRISSNQSLGDVTLVSGGTLIIDAGTTLTINGVWSGGGTIINNGTIELVGPSAFPGITTTMSAMQNLTINNPGGVLLDQSMQIDGTLSLIQGTFDISTLILTMGASSPPINGTFSSSCMIIADGGGEVRKAGLSKVQASFFFPIGDKNGTPEYSPINLVYPEDGTYNGYSGIKVSNQQHPNDLSTNNYINRYWSLSINGYPNVDLLINANFVNDDVIGTIDSIQSARYYGIYPWIKGNATHPADIEFAFKLKPNSDLFDLSGIARPYINILPLDPINVCLNDPLTLTAFGKGTTPYSFLWMPGNGNSPTFSPSTSNVGGVTYTATITDANGLT